MKQNAWVLGRLRSKYQNLWRMNFHALLKLRRVSGVMLLISCAAAALGHASLDQKWGFLTMVVGAWLGLNFMLRFGFLTYIIRARRHAGRD